MSTMDERAAMDVRGAGEHDTSGGSALPPDDAVTFLAAPTPTTPLAEVEVYRPGALVASALLLPPMAAALVLAALYWNQGRLPFWLPLAPLLWIPISLVGWFPLRNVRLTRESIAFGRPLGAWRTVPLDAITRVERHGPRLTLTATDGHRISFMPFLLRRGGRLQRRLLISLPMQALDSVTRAEAQRLLDGPGLGMDDLEITALTVRPPRWMAVVAGLVAGAALVAGVAIATLSTAPWLAVAPGAVALIGLAALIWLAQEVFISDRGVIARFALVRLTRAVAWDETLAIEAAPGAVALILRGPVTLICVGPGLLFDRDARRMREVVYRYGYDRGLARRSR